MKGGNYARYTYDEAVSRWGSKLPTKEQLVELKNKCRWKWTTRKGVKGYKVIGPNGKSIFLPAAGYCHCSGNVNRVGVDGNCWSSSPGGSGGAWSLYFYSSAVRMNFSERCGGLSVRLVQN